MLRTFLLTTTAAIALSGAALTISSARAEGQAAADETVAVAKPGPSVTDPQTAFAQGIKSIKSWFGSDNSDDTAATATPETDTTSASADIQVPPPAGNNATPADIEPAAGFDEDTLQAPTPYYGPQSDASAPQRATSFDGTQSMSAFNDAQPEGGNANGENSTVADIKSVIANPASTDAGVTAAAVAAATAQAPGTGMGVVVGATPADIANIAPAAGDTPLDPTKMDCDAILKAADTAEEGDIPDTALIEACETPKEGATDGKTPAQPAFEPGPAGVPQALPETQPAAGEPPIGGAVMPGEKQGEAKAK